MLGQQLLQRLRDVEGQRDALRAQLEEQLAREEAQRGKDAAGGGGVVALDKWDALQSRWKKALEEQEALKGELKEGNVLLLRLGAWLGTERRFLCSGDGD